MHILLAASTLFEIQPAVDYLSLKNGSAGRTSAKSPHHHRISTLTTGVGTLSTTWSLMRQIGRDRPDLIIQAGIAGSFSGKPPGQVFAVRDEILADLGVWEDGRFKSVFDLRLADPDHPPFTAGRLCNPYQSLIDLSGLEPVGSITVNEISTNPGKIAWHRQHSAAEIESMEGGALHYVALQERIPFLQIRSVSNETGVRDKAKWNIPLAIRQLNDRLTVLLEELDQRDISILNTINDVS